MKRGFKKRAKEIGLEIRKELGLQIEEAIDCFNLLEKNKIPVHSVEKLNELGLSTEDISTICYSKQKYQFSATTISTPNGPLIIYNQSHSSARINSTLVHEFSHIILEHEFSLISEMESISREFDKEKEDEANWLTGCILLPENSLIWALKRKMSISEIAQHFNISKKMSQWRYNSTGMKNRSQYF